MRNITRKEELILLSVLNLRKNAYLVAIHEHLSNVTNKDVSLTSVHLPLSRLEKNGLLTSAMGEATPERGGRRKKIYTVTSLGFAALNEYKRISDVLWATYLTPKIG